MSARRRSQSQMQPKNSLGPTHRDPPSTTLSHPATTTDSAGRAMRDKPTPSQAFVKTDSATEQSRRPSRKTAKGSSGQPATTMAPPPDKPPSSMPATSARPQRQAKVDALAKKVWSAITPGAGRKRANPTIQNVSDGHTAAPPDTMTQPANKKHKGAVEPQIASGGAAFKNRRVSGAAVQPHPDSSKAVPNTSAKSAPIPRPVAVRKATTIPRVQLSIDSESDGESGEDIPLARTIETTNTSNVSSTSKDLEGKSKSEQEKQLTSKATASQTKAPSKSIPEPEDNEQVIVESDASDSADCYAPEEDDDEAFSEEDELNDQLSEDLEELEAQLRAEAPVWTEEQDALLPPVLRRKKAKKPQAILLNFEEDEEEPTAAGVSSQQPTSKASQHRLLEQPLWKTAEPTPNSDAEDDWGPRVYTIPSLEDGYWEENRRVPAIAAEESDTQSDDLQPNGADFHPQAYKIKPLLTPGGVLSLKEQNEHIQDTIHHTFTRVESNLVFTNGFPDAVGRARFVFEAMRDSARELGYKGLHRRLGQDASFTRTLASLPNQRISTFHSNIKKHTDSAVIAFYGLQPGLAADKIEWLFDHLKYIYPLVHEPADKHNTTWAKPYQNHAVTSTLHMCFFTGGTAIGNRDETRFVSSRPDREDEREIPMPMLALVGAMLHASLSEWRTGIHKKGTFSADAFLDAYTEHITLLTGIKTQNLRAYHTMMHRLYTEASGAIPLAATPAGNASDALAHVDFAGMDVD